MWLNCYREGFLPAQLVQFWGTKSPFSSSWTGGHGVQAWKLRDCLADLTVEKTGPLLHLHSPSCVPQCLRPRPLHSSKHASTSTKASLMQMELVHSSLSADASGCQGGVWSKASTRRRQSTCCPSKSAHRGCVKKSVVTRASTRICSDASLLEA